MGALVLVGAASALDPPLSTPYPLPTKYPEPTSAPVPTDAPVPRPTNAPVPQHHPRPFEVLYCIDDITSLCPAEKASMLTSGLVPVFACLKTKEAQLSAKCSAALQSLVPFHCANDAQ